MAQRARALISVVMLCSTCFLSLMTVDAIGGLKLAMLHTKT